MRFCFFTRWWRLSFIVGLGLAASLSVRGQGLSKQDRVEVSALAELPESVRAGQRPAEVDLRDKLPAVGRQSMNDCAAWAFGYAARSYLEAVDQGWRPDAPERIFSPTFIYNQVNRGEDKGSNPGEVLKLLQSRGAATLAAVPYRAKDFKWAPPAGAAPEAELFKIERAYLLHDGEAIREALAAGDIVVVGVRTNPVFSSGRYERYTAAMHESARLARKPDQPHGYHAMVICGYSEERKAFLFMNSWGQEWGQRGFVWICYDAVDVFNNSVVTENLMDFACVLVDRRGLVRREGAGYVATSADALAARVNGRFAGSSVPGQASYLFNLALEGPPGLREKVKQVTWSYVDDAGKPVTLVSKSAAVGFAAHGLTANRLQGFTARAEFHNGTTQDYACALALDETKAHTPRMGRVDQFYGFDAKTREPRWHVAYYPDLSDADWRQLKSIYWQVGGNRYTYTHGGGLAPDFAGRSGAYMTEFTGKPSTGELVFEFKDQPGVGYRVPLPDGAFTTEAKDELQLTYVVRPVGGDAGKEWYYYEVQARYPLGWSGNIRLASAIVGAEDREEAGQMRLVKRYGTQLHVTDGFMSMPSTAQVRLDFINDAPPWNTRNTYSMHHVLKTGNEKEPDTDGGLSIAFTDTYLGEVNGVPTWRYRGWINRLNGMLAFDTLSWQVDGRDVAQVEEGEPKPAGQPVHQLSRIKPEWSYLEFTHDAKPVTVKAALTFHENSIEQDRRPRTFSRVFEPGMPANDALGLIVVEGVKDRLLANEDLSAGMVTVRLTGTRAALAEVNRLEAFYDTPWGGRDRMTTALDGRAGPAERLELRLPQLKAGATVQVEAVFEDESRVALQSKAAPDSPFLYAARLQLEARERFLGYDGGLPRWGGQLRVTGDHLLVKAIERVEYRAVAIDGTAVPVTPAKTTPREAGVGTSEPLTITARVHFTAASGFQPMEIETVMRTSAERAKDELRLAIDRVWRAPHKTRPNDMIADMEDPEFPRVLHLAGHARALARVAGVDYTSTDEGGTLEKIEGGKQRLERGVDGFPGFRTFYGGKHAVEATVRFKDGKTARFKAEVVQELEGPPPDAITKRVRFWETNAQGVPTYLVSYRLLEADERVKVDYNLGGTHAAVWPWGATSFARGAFAWDGVVWGEDPGLATIEGYSPAYEGSDELEKMEIYISEELAKVGALPAVIATHKLEVVADPAGQAQVSFVRLVAPEKWLGKVARVDYEVEQGGKVRTLRPLDRFGETGDSFECRIVGAKPTRITARLIGHDGAPVGEGWVWTADGK